MDVGIWPIKEDCLLNWFCDCNSLTFTCAFVLNEVCGWEDGVDIKLVIIFVVGIVDVGTAVEFGSFVWAWIWGVVFNDWIGLWFISFTLSWFNWCCNNVWLAFKEGDWFTILIGPRLLFCNNCEVTSFLFWASNNNDWGNCCGECCNSCDCCCNNWFCWACNNNLFE